MPNLTTNYSFKKTARHESADISVLNSNFDSIDAALLRPYHRQRPHIGIQQREGLCRFSGGSLTASKLSRARKTGGMHPLSHWSRCLPILAAERTRTQRKVPQGS